jgi:hypothetical protein
LLLGTIYYITLGAADVKKKSPLTPSKSTKDNITKENTGAKQEIKKGTEEAPKSEKKLRRRRAVVQNTPDVSKPVVFYLNLICNES